MKRRIGAKGQVTIPAELRRQAGLLPGSEIEVVLVGRNVVLRRPIETRPEGNGAQLVNHLRGRGDIPISTDEVMALTRGR